MTQKLRVVVREVHDGMGGVHLQGHIIDMPDDVASILVARKTCVPVEGGIYADELEKAKEREAELKLVAQQQIAQRSQRHYDSLPPEIRALAREHGDRVLDDVYAGLEPDEIIAKWTASSTMTLTAGSQPGSSPATTAEPSASSTSKTANRQSKKTRRRKTTLLPAPKATSTT